MNLDIDGKPLAIIFKFEGGFEELLDHARKRCKGNDVILLIKYDESLIGRLVPAYANALARKNWGGMKANSLEKEMLLFVAHTLNVNEAIRKAGMAHGRNILFSNSNDIAMEFSISENLNTEKEIRLSLDIEAAPRVAELGLKD